ncbi:sigma 54-interacting transcriptional regulator [Tundrisphaera lichenicola]|uniref:sigma 54-interacting transcriptional regulator n=1 Tax=Tundrisphaera lichenicola TaxID=2029860 RepID=UPI003EBA937C
MAWTGNIGLNCVLGYEVKEAVAPDFIWKSARPSVGDILTGIDGHPIEHYPAYVAAMRDIRDRVGDSVEVTWKSPTGGPEQHASAVVRYRPMRTYRWSLLWFIQEMAIFALGARVYWKRPRDESALVFFLLCFASVGAYMGGYHWAEVVVEPFLIYGFAAFAVFVPVLSLHFYLVFPRLNPIFERHRRTVLSTLYGVPVAFVGILWSFMFRLSLLRGGVGPDALVAVDATLAWIKYLAFGYIALSVAVFGLCILCLNASYRSAVSRAERNQTYWILLASWLGVLPIGYLLWNAWWEPYRLGLSSAAWPMYVVSLLYTVAYALSITRYRLMQVEEIYNRSKIYVVVSLAAGLLYSGVLVGTTLLIGERLLTPHTSRGAVVMGGVVIVLLVLSGAIRERFQRVIDRRFYREKYKFDEAMQKMNLAVGRLVDRTTLGQRLLEAAAEILRVEWGAIYLAEAPDQPLKLAAWHGPEPEVHSLPTDNPLVNRLRENSTLRAPHAMALVPASDPATDTMIALGGEVAKALEADDLLVGLMVLGPKRSGLAYEDEEVAFLGALGSVAMLALHSAGIQQTLERLNLELRDKVDKIAEQQRRILLLQDQLTDRGKSASRLEPSDPVDPGVFEEIRGSGPAVLRMREVARKVAPSQAAVLIRGESGTGKELLAQAIHAAGPRANRPFVRVHCAALSQGLLESELFGHVKGAFTGADGHRVGRFEQADGGTLFLDEIGDINLEVQTKLLRVLQEMAFERVGSSQTIAVDVRIVAATHQDLESLIRAGRFREDLFYRLNVIPIRTPSLRERKEDIFELAVHFLGRHAERMARSVGHIDDEAVEALISHDWPGNIRELENVIERAVVLSEGPALTLADLPLEIREPGRRRGRFLVPAELRQITGRRTRGTSTVPGVSGSSRSDEPEIDSEADAFERHRLLDALEEARGNKSEAARLLGLPRSTFFSKLKKHGLPAQG